MSKHFCFDLEDTLIAPVLSGWGNWEPILGYIELFKNIIRVEQPSTVNIFSFAIHDNHELTLFNHHVRSTLEEMLGRGFTFVPTVLGGSTSIRTVCAAHHRMDPLSVSFEDMVSFWSKAGSFQLWAPKRFKTGEVHLFDDAVETSTIQFHEKELTLHLHRV